MYDAKRVRALYNRRRRLTRGLADFDRRAAVIRASLAEIEADLQTMLLFVPPLTTRKPVVVLTRDLLDRLRLADAPTTREVTLWVMERKGLVMPEPRVYRRLQNRVWFALNRLKERGLVLGEPESRRVVRWKLA